MTSQAFAADGLANLDTSLQELVDRGEFAGITYSLWRNDSEVARSFGVQDLATGVPMQPNSIVRISSLTKAVTAVATWQLIEDGVLTLDDAIERWLPELGSRQVLRTLDSEIDVTEPAKRAITVRNCLSFTLGFGVTMAPPNSTPIDRALRERSLAPSAIPPQMSPDEWLQRLGELPLMHQPGEDWMYNTGSEVLGVLIERVTGRDLGDVFAERIFKPLGMVDSGFSVPTAKLDRFATAYCVGSDGLEVYDPAIGGKFSSPPPLRSGTGGLVSTASDFLRFARMLLDGGGDVVSADSARWITHDQTTRPDGSSYPGLRTFLGENIGWGGGVSVITAPGPFGHATGTYGWTGGLNCHWCTDPANNLVGIVLTQREMTGPHDMAIAETFWKGVYALLA